MASLALSRRSLLTGLGTASIVAAKPSIARTANPDVVIVGAGAAGIGAAQTLRARGISCVIVEAANRIGGRAFTDTKTFAMPFDLGCGWLQAADRNPYFNYAICHGYRTRFHKLDVNRLFYGDKDAGDDAVDAEHAAEEAIHKRVDAIGQTKDIPVSDIVPERTPPFDAAATYMGPMDMAVDFKNLSTMDYGKSADLDPNYLIYEGYGTLVKQQAGALPVALGNPVKRISQTKTGVSVETAHGTIRARAVIVTVSTGVLAVNGIGLDKDLLPEWKEKAIVGVPMGLLAKIPMVVKGGGLGVEPFQNVLDQRPNGESIYFLAWPWQSELMVGFVGGDFGFELSKRPVKEIFDFATDRLAGMFGSAVRDKIGAKLFTPWASNPLTLGAYAAARPGDFAARAALGRPVADRVYFAGEALAPDGLIQLCSGAFLSGIATAKEVAAKFPARAPGREHAAARN